MSLTVATLPNSRKTPAEPKDPREELMHRVASSATFEKSPRLRAFLLHACRCALEFKPEEATEQQIGINVYGRSPSYNPNDDNIVRSQARVLRMKLEHHFANEGKDEPMVITMPKGKYLPAFEPRVEERSVVPQIAQSAVAGNRLTRRILAGVAVLSVLLAIGLGYLRLRKRPANAPLPVVSTGSASMESLAGALG